MATKLSCGRRFLAVCLCLASSQGIAKDRIEVQGHRGARGVFPENSLVAFDHALSVGVDTLELDTVVSRDDQLVVNHDLKVNPALCLGKNGVKIGDDVFIRKLSWSELADYDCGALGNPLFPRQKILPGTHLARLDDVFELVKKSKHPSAKTVRFNIEAKTVPGLPDLAPPADRFAELLIKAAIKHGMLGRISIQSFDHRVLKAVKKIDPQVPVAALTADNFVNYTILARDLKAEVISPNQNWITKEAVTDLHAAGVKVIPWTANKPSEWQRLLDLDVDGIITDYPQDLIKFLADRDKT